VNTPLRGAIRGHDRYLAREDSNGDRIPARLLRTELRDRCKFQCHSALAAELSGEHETRRNDPNAQESAPDPQDRCPRVAAFLARYLYSHHMENRLLPLKQTVPHLLEPRTTFLIRTRGS
jgi:hypothetical protein